MISNNLEFYKDIFENLPEAILICNKEFMIIDANKLLEDIIKFDKKEIIGKFSSELITTDKIYCPICKNNANSACLPECFIHPAEIVDNNKNKIPVRISHKNLDNYFIFVITPLSNIACLDQAHMDFVSTVSHELRTPLTSIKGFADTLLSSSDKLSPDTQKRFISIIKSQIDRLTRLVENLLTVSRLEAKKDKSIYKAVNLKEFFNPVLQNISAKSKNHIINVQITEKLAPIWVDSDKLEQIMTNLIDNAVKYSNPDTKITISANFLPDNPEYVEIKVIDQGIGIPDQFLPQIFSKFSRIDNPLTRQTEGTGLGLYITKSLVENMGGKISVESDKNGTIFTVVFSVANPEKHVKQKFLENK